MQLVGRVTCAPLIGKFCPPAGKVPLVGLVKLKPPVAQEKVVVLSTFFRMML
jgi:hypothetical protein